MIFGRTSLFTFCFGNILLYAIHLWDPAAPADPFRFVWSSAAALSLSVVYARFRDSNFIRKSRHPFARAYRWVADESSPALVRFLTAPFLRGRDSATKLSNPPAA